METKCCNCGSNDIMNVEYGTPNDEMIKRIEKGEILHGGCAISGLMQKYYCMDCDSRFDDECTDLFINHIRQIEIVEGNNHTEIHFTKDKLQLKIGEFEKVIDYTDNIKNELKQSQVEFYQSYDTSKIKIRIECFGYIQDVVEKTIADNEPVNGYKFLDWINKLKK